MTPLEVEIEHRKAHGARLLSVAELEAAYNALGYRLDRDLDCRSISRYLDSGRTYPACTTGLKEADSGRSAFHFESRRDSNFRAMQELRGSAFAISRGAILEV